MTRKATAKPTGGRRKKKTAQSRKPSRAALAARRARLQQGKTQLDLLAEFLAEPGGHSGQAIARKFGWLPHSTRSAISRLKGVKTTKTEAGTIYSIPRKA